MGYTFGTGATDIIDCGTGVTHDTVWTLAVQFALTTSADETRVLATYHDGTATLNALAATFAGSTDQFGALFSTGNGGSYANDLNFYTGGLTPGSPHCMVLTNSGAAGGFKMYADGSSTPRTSGGDGVAPDQGGTQHFTIGNQYAGTVSAHATIYQVAWYAGTALTADQAGLLSGGTRMPNDFPVPTHYWPLESDATALYGGQDGTVTGASFVSDSAVRWFPVADPLTEQQTALWICPDWATSDYATLFDDPAPWATTLSLINIFKFYAGAAPGPVVQSGAPLFLTSRNIGIATESAVIKSVAAEATYAPNGYLRLALDWIEYIAARGGTVTHIAMDEPLWGGITLRGFSMAECADRTAAFIQGVHAKYPSVNIGDIEPVGPTSLSSTDILAWLDALIARGARPGFFHIDLAPMTTNYSAWTPLLTECASRNIALGFIIMCSTDVATDAEFYTGAMGFVTRFVNGEAARPPEFIVQSWAVDTDTGLSSIPTILSETTNYTHTKLFLDAVAALEVSKGTWPGPRPPLLTTLRQFQDSRT